MIHNNPSSNCSNLPHVTHPTTKNKMFTNRTRLRTRIRNPRESFEAEDPERRVLCAARYDKALTVITRSQRRDDRTARVLHGVLITWCSLSSLFTLSTPRLEMYLLFFWWRKRKLAVDNVKNRQGWSWQTVVSSSSLLYYLFSFYFWRFLVLCISGASRIRNEVRSTKYIHYILMMQYITHNDVYWPTR